MYKYEIIWSPKAFLSRFIMRIYALALSGIVGSGIVVKW